SKMLPIAVVDQGVEIVGCGEDNVAALAAIAPVWAAELDEFLAAKARSPAPTVTAFEIDFALVEELHLAGSTRPYRTRRISLTAGKNRLATSKKCPSSLRNML